MREIIIATKNAGKVKDFETLFSPKGFKVTSLLDFPEIEDVEETGVTFAENATLKAETISSALNKPVIADDSGLAIDALNGEPGVYSARYAGENKDDNANIEKVLQNYMTCRLKSARHVFIVRLLLQCLEENRACRRHV